MEKNRYKYNGPVIHFDKIVDYQYKAETFATSVAKALSNLAYRWNVENNIRIKITLDRKYLTKVKN